MKIENTKFDGLKIVRHFSSVDARGAFIKPWITNELSRPFGEVAEAYFSFSEQGVFRGLHYQQGSYAQKKLVVCLSGSIEDVALDMRPDSSTYGEVFRKRLDGMSGVGLIIPEGFAHGIFAHVSSIIVNFCNKPYSAEMESGVNWQSLGALSDLGVLQLSDKDADLPSWREFRLWRL